MSTAPTLPPLPDPSFTYERHPGGFHEPVRVGAFTAEKMHAYATAHASALAQRVEELQRIADEWAALSQDDGKKDREIARLTTAHAVAVELGATYAARVDELLVDAERYRRIRNGPWSDRWGDVYAMTFQRTGDIPLKLTRLDECVDRAIDAARKGDQQHG